ncbi:chemotaxis protein CheC [Scatolibacter rhodanostii]|uniref:chemotaxis protein CheC n=1 Tax=Scatolibacter rhodanostii TaxID=2014781 RepID=UPI000C073DD1|nr:chemotaxis protein CheC [Scatolibacter rhodanostii]
MSLKDYNDLNDMQLDALREIGNIGSGNAASALASMLDQPVNIEVPKIRILDYQTVVDNLGGPEQLMVGLLLSLEGDTTGMIMFLLQKEFAHMMLNTLMGSAFPENGEVDEDSESAIREVGNIMAASYINAIAELTGLRINISVPSICIDMVGSILSVPAIYYANISDKIIFIEDEFNQGTSHASSHILLIPEVESLQKIMTSLGLEE